MHITIVGNNMKNTLQNRDREVSCLCYLGMYQKINRMCVHMAANYDPNDVRETEILHI